MSKDTDAAVAAALRPVAAALVGPDTVRREKEHDSTHDKSGQLRAEKVEGRLRDNRTGVVDSGAVMLPAREATEDRPARPVRSLKKHFEDGDDQGPAGPAGPPGADGTIGVDGAPGPTGPAGADGNVGTWSLLTTGDPVTPELIWAGGDVIPVWSP